MLETEPIETPSGIRDSVASKQVDVSDVQSSWAALEFISHDETATQKTIRPASLYAVDAPSCPLHTPNAEPATTSEVLFSELSELLLDNTDLGAMLEDSARDDSNMLEDSTMLEHSTLDDDVFDHVAPDDETLDHEAFDTGSFDHIEVIDTPVAEPALESRSGALVPPPLPQVYFEPEPLLPTLTTAELFDHDLYDDSPDEPDEFIPVNPGETSGLGSDEWDLIHHETRRTRKTKAPKRRLFGAGSGRVDEDEDDSWAPPLPSPAQELDDDGDISIAERLASMELSLLPVPTATEEPATAKKPIDLAEILESVTMPCDLAPIPGDACGFGSRNAAYFTTLYRTLEIGVALQKELNTIGMKLQTISPGRAVASNGTNTLLVTLHDHAKNFPSVPAYSIVVEIELV